MEEIQQKIFSYLQAKRIFVCGDIHGDFGGLVSRVCQSYSFTDTLVIVAGDCGFGFEKFNYYVNTYNRFAGKLRKANNWIVFVRGNHDDSEYFSAEKIHFTRFRCVPDYSVIQACDHNILCVGGAVSIDRMKRIRRDESRIHQETALYWKDEMPVFSPEAIEALKAPIDTVVSHTCPSFCFPTTKDGVAYWMEDDRALEADLGVERQTIDKIYGKLKAEGHPLKKWFYGHYHQFSRQDICDVQFRLLDCMDMEAV